MESLYSTFFSPAPCRLHHLGLLDLPSEGSGTGCRLSGGASVESEDLTVEKP